MSEASEVGEFHCCCTGDCDHDDVHDCNASLTEHIKELTRDYKRVEVAARAVIESARFSSDGRSGRVPDEEIELLEKAFQSEGE